MSSIFDRYAATARRLLACAVLAGLAVGGANAAEVKTIESGTILAGSDQVYPPYDYVENGVTKGLDADVMALIAPKLGLEVRFIDTRFANLIAGLQANRFDIIAEQQRAATGEVQVGQLQFAGLDQGHRKIQLVRWGDNAQWWDARGQSERRGAMGMPVAGHVTSTYGNRMHPLLGFMRMHRGMDIGAPYGSPIHAASDGVVAQAGRAGGYGNFVKLAHPGGVATGYGHMSRIAVRAGQHVSRGQVIGYVGSTGLSTGPHLHWEVWKNGVSVNPRSISLSSVAVLSGKALREFKAKVANLLATAPAR